MLEELSGGEFLVELLVGDEPVLATVLLTLPPIAGRRRDGELDLGHPAQKRPFQGAFARTRGAGYDKNRVCRVTD